MCNKKYKKVINFRFLVKLSSPIVKISMPIPQELLQGFHSIHVQMIEVVVVSSLDSVGSKLVVVFSVVDFVVDFGVDFVVDVVDFIVVGHGPKLHSTVLFLEHSFPP